MSDRPRTAVVTGATRGIGRVVARRFAEAGYRVVLVGRDPTRCAEAAEMIRTRTARTDTRTVVADLSTRAGVRTAAAGVSEASDRVDVLVNNAGAVYETRAETADGLERTFALNVLAPYLLTTLLRPTLVAAAPSRVVMVDSSAHQGVTLDLDDLQGARRYSGFTAYSRSKLALLYLTHEFARRWAGSGVTVTAVHPGFVRTGFGRNNPGGLGWGIRLASVFAISAERGAETPFYVGSSPDVAADNGLYFVKSRPVRSSQASYDADAAGRLWAACEALSGGYGEAAGIAPGSALPR